MKQKLKNNNGITIVTLVITIVIMLILAGVTVKITTGKGTINEAENTKSEYNLEEEKAKIKSGYLSYISAKMTDDNARLYVKDAQTTGNATSGWTATFTKTNNEYKLTKDGKVILTKQNGIDVIWINNGDDTFTKGEVTVKLGDIVNYDEGTVYSTTVEASKSGYDSNQTFKTEKSGWRVLGLSADGEIELISDNPTSTRLYLKGELGYLNAEKILNNMCNELYGKGEHATGARSLNVEDINKLENYDPTTYSAYGEIYTYRFPTSGNYMQYKRTKADGTLITDWTNITTCQTYRAPGETEAEKISADNRNDTGRSLENTSDIISNGTGSRDVWQWLASRCINCTSKSAGFYVRYVCSIVSNTPLYSSSGDPYSISGHVRPVVTLESDIQLSGNSTDGWTIN